MRKKSSPPPARYLFEKIPKKMLVIGAGVIGVELGSVYQRLGSEVVFIEFLDRICPTLDESISKNLQQLLTAQGMTFHLSSKVTNANISDTVTLQVSSADKGESQITGDVVLVCIGRRPYTQGLQLEKAGITLTPKRARFLSAACSAPPHRTFMPSEM